MTSSMLGAPDDTEEVHPVLSIERRDGDSVLKSTTRMCSGDHVRRTKHYDTYTHSSYDVFDPRGRKGVG